MKRWIVIAVVAMAACDNAAPQPPPPSRAALDERFPYQNNGSSALDEAVRNDRLDDVRRLLAGGADPNVRCCGGDYFALKEAFRDWGPPITHRVEIVRLLLAHGADPNMRWCPFETRGSVDEKMRCVSGSAWTPLIAAAYLDSPEIVEMLLAAGASPWPRDWIGAAAVDYASSERVMELLARAHFPDDAGRSQKMLRLLDDFAGSPAWPTPWNDTALSRAFIRSYGYAAPPPPPPPPALPGSEAPAPLRDMQIPGRVRARLTLGADPNQRVRLGGADWPPLAMAIHVQAPLAAQHLLEHGAEVNARWCVPIDFREVAAARDPEARCTPASGFTPLMWASRSGDVEAVELLLEFKADRSLRDWAGRSALDYAQDPGVRKLLSEAR